MKKNSDVNVNVRITSELNNKIEFISKRTFLKKSEWIRIFIKDGVEKYKDARLEIKK